MELKHNFHEELRLCCFCFVVCFCLFARFLFGCWWVFILFGGGGGGGVRYTEQVSSPAWLRCAAFGVAVNFMTECGFYY